MIWINEESNKKIGGNTNLIINSFGIYKDTIDKDIALLNHDIFWLKIQEIIQAKNLEIAQEKNIDAELIYNDNDEGIMCYKFNTVYFFIGYFHFQENLTSRKEYHSNISRKIIDFINRMKTLSLSNNWQPMSIMAISTFQISKFKGIDFNSWPDDARVRYCYLKSEKDYYIFGNDNQIKLPDFNIVRDEINLIERLQQYRYNIEHCSLCGGDNETGCLYFDPSECPRQT